MTEQEILDTFLDAVDGLFFSPEHQEAAKEWLFKRDAALEYLNDLKKGILP
jgi:hypothetical protein